MSFSLSRCDYSVDARTPDTQLGRGAFARYGVYDLNP